MPRRSSFRDPQLQAEFEDVGYVAFPLLGQLELEALSELANTVPVDTDPFYQSAVSGDTELRKRLGLAIRKICADPIGRVFDEHRVVFGSLLVKRARDPASWLGPHLDWTSVDESLFTGCNVWTSLAPTSEENGTLCFFPRSHHLVRTPRGTPLIRHEFSDMPAERIELYGQLVTLEPGEAVAWDQRVIHWSPANLSSQPRVAFAIGVVPAEAQLMHFFRTETGRVQQYAVADDFYASFEIGHPPEGELLSEFEVTTSPVDETEVRRVCGGGGVSAGHATSSKHGSRLTQSIRRLLLGNR